MLKIFPKYLNFENISKKYIRVPGPYEMYKKLLYTRKNILKIPVNTGNFTKKVIISAFLTILFRV